MRVLPIDSRSGSRGGVQLGGFSQFGLVRSVLIFRFLGGLS